MKKIVMIEDNEDHVLLIRQALQSGDLNISHFQDGMSAIQNFKEIKRGEDAPDLILLDLKLPGMDGCEVLKRLRQIRFLECIPVVMVTTSGRKEEIRQAYKTGVCGYVTKSEDFDEFSVKLKCVIQYWLKTVESAKLACSESEKDS
ncbi:MAG: hypothetical protein A3G33_05695 [Omnitrophica bacterium RIFCSPLOWO2_12_FULL_44_17]|uniref:Response regulatory domain-containing protein n=1 Tax=Candidatus Danuiimicrobium aquiferis TaxID=1801832 RepID=A0A1G1L358_9BACT|nr:MAG: hypothetical protein A3B72_05175 [Omnitrophica bacterium RIFCSPHIGHO2_02_FULL_45_28]OGW89892.1 MAG: hypothetical protein A3E74_01835 [Omnitrophica bacterium RIFCSPHIGHO2_12_FULL_44_12]OGW99564.1 MAG: hypothetical protein A3G33_05695 [Omnitrophica bacterium RIFCSPLOWO2_12_FULL_44_17]OGX04013.1 MAG: hypothetical protein A3J12_06235 [Omnitrophica bacterium RIFCSPLOWO2_02_FULL_44_11]